MNYLYKEKVRKYIIENFPLAIEISNIAPIFLIGGALRDIELLTTPKDLDFVVLSDTDEIIKTFIEMIKREITDEEQLKKLEDAIAFKNVSNMPARVKCVLLAWHTMEDLLEKNGK